MSKFKRLLSVSVIGGFFLLLSTYVHQTSQWIICGFDNDWCRDNSKDIAFIVLVASSLFVIASIYFALKQDIQSRSHILHKWKVIFMIFFVPLVLGAFFAIHEMLTPCGGFFCITIFFPLFQLIFILFIIALLSTPWTWLFKANPGWTHIIPMFIGISLFVVASIFALDKYEAFRSLIEYPVKQDKQYNNNVLINIRRNGYADEDLDVCKQLKGEEYVKDCKDEVTQGLDYAKRTVESFVSQCKGNTACVERVAETMKSTFPGFDVDKIIQNR